MRLSDRAKAQLAGFRRHYRRNGRPEAAHNVTKALTEAADRIGMGFSVAAPTPYPELKRDGEAWVKAGRYWFLHTTTEPIIALAVFYDNADIPGRI